MNIKITKELNVPIRASSEIIKVYIPNEIADVVCIIKNSLKNFNRFIYFFILTYINYLLSIINQKIIYKNNLN